MLTGPVSGALTLAGSGMVVLDETSGTTGTFTISAGALAVGDASTPGAVYGGGVTVNGGTLQGYGTVGGAGGVTNTAGVVVPGGTAGTIGPLTVTNAYTQGAAGTLQAEVSPSAASELLVGGSATLAGTLALTFDPGTYAGGAVYPVLTAGAAVSGTFDGLTVDLTTGEISLGALAPEVGYQPNQVSVTLVPFVGNQVIGSGTTYIVSDDSNLGGTAGTLDFEGGTLQTAATFTTNLAVTLGLPGGTFSPESGTTLTLAGVVTGSGGLNASGPGTLVLAGLNTYAGGTTVSGGTLAVSSDTLGDAAGLLTINGGTLETTATFATARSVAGGALGGILSPDSGTVLTLTGAVSGGLTLVGPGTLVVDAITAGTGGTFTVSAGTLMVGDALTPDAVYGGNVVVTGGTLQGHGTISGEVTNTSGTVAPGGTTGTLTVAGNYSQGSGAPCRWKWVRRQRVSWRWAGRPRSPEPWRWRSTPGRTAGPRIRC